MESRAHLDTLQKHAKSKYMEVSINGASPKWMVYSGKSIKQNPIYLRGFRSHGATPINSWMVYQGKS